MCPGLLVHTSVMKTVTVCACVVKSDSGVSYELQNTSGEKCEILNVTQFPSIMFPFNCRNN